MPILNELHCSAPLLFNFKNPILRKCPAVFIRAWHLDVECSSGTELCFRTADSELFHPASGDKFPPDFNIAGLILDPSRNTDARFESDLYSASHHDLLSEGTYLNSGYQSHRETTSSTVTIFQEYATSEAKAPYTFLHTAWQVASWFFARVAFSS